MTPSTPRSDRRSVPLIALWALVILGLVAGIILLAIDEGSVPGFGWTAYPPLSQIEAPDYLPNPLHTADLGYLSLLVAAMALVGALVLHGFRSALWADRDRQNTDRDRQDG